MEHIAKAIQSIGNSESMRLGKSLQKSGAINALDLAGVSAGKSDFAKIEKMMRAVFPKVQTAKYNLLFALIKDDDWSEKRLRETAKHLVKTYKYPEWTIADWFEYGAKLYPYSKYLKELHENRLLNDEITWFRIDDVVLWGYTHETKNIPGLEKYLKK